MRAILGIFERLQEQREHCDHVELMVRTGQEQYNSKSRIVSRVEQDTFQRRLFPKEGRSIPNAEQSIFKRRGKYCDHAEQMVVACTTRVNVLQLQRIAMVRVFT